MRLRRPRRRLRPRALDPTDAAGPPPHGEDVRVPDAAREVFSVLLERGAFSGVDLGMAGLAFFAWGVHEAARRGELDTDFYVMGAVAVTVMAGRGAAGGTRDG